MPHRLPPQALVLLKRQQLVLARWQAADVNISARTIKRAVTTEQWRQITDRTYLTHPGEPTRQQRDVAGCLEMGPAAVLGGLTALVAAGWRGDDDGNCHVVVPHGTNVSQRRPPPWMRVHAVPVSATDDGPVPRTTVAGSAIDAAAWARTDREASFLLISVVQQQLTTPALLQRALRLRGRVHRRALMRDVVDDAEQGTRSMPELDFVRQCRQRGLPIPRRQTKRRDANGRRRFTDAEFDLPGGGLLIVEIDGAGHLQQEQAGSDAVRNSALARATGGHVVTVTSFVLRYDPEPFFAELERWLTPFP